MYFSFSNGCFYSFCLVFPWFQKSDTIPQTCGLVTLTNEARPSEREREREREMESPFKAEVLKGKVALITGGGSGIGFEISTQFGKHGASIAIMGRRKEVLDLAVSALHSQGIQVLFYFLIKIFFFFKIFIWVLLVLCFFLMGLFFAEKIDHMRKKIGFWLLPLIE